MPPVLTASDLENPRLKKCEWRQKTASRNFFENYDARAPKNRPQLTNLRRVAKARRRKNVSDARHHRNRYYSPKLGRFISRDSRYFDDGANLYAYCHNRAVDLSDPFGTSCADQIYNAALAALNDIKNAIVDGLNDYQQWCDDHDIEDPPNPFTDFASLDDFRNWQRWIEDLDSGYTHSMFNLIGSDADKRAFYDLLDQISYNSDVSISDKLYNLLSEAEEYDVTITLTLVNGVSNILVDSFDLSTVDIGDILKFPSDPGAGATQEAVFSHMLFEQIFKQVEDLAYDPAHSLAVGIESELSGMTRSESSNFPNGSGSITQNVFRGEDGTTVVQMLYFDANGNLTSVNYTVHKPTP